MEIAPEVLLAIGLIPAALANALSIGCLIRGIYLWPST